MLLATKAIWAVKAVALPSARVFAAIDHTTTTRRSARKDATNRIIAIRPYGKIARHAVAYGA